MEEYIGINLFKSVCPKPVFPSSPFLTQRNAEKKTHQNRSQARRQTRTRRFTQTLSSASHCHHHHHHVLLPPPPPRPHPPKPHLQSPTHRPFPIMEVEVKLRLQDAAAYRQLIIILSPFFSKTLHQQNLFFDTPTNTLSSQLSVLRLRFLNNDARCIVSLKSKPTLVDGVSRVEEDEEELDPCIARASVEDPSRLGKIDSRVLKRVKDEFGIGGEMGLVCLGGFENKREVFDWKNLKLEVDETKYEFGTCYEVECESVDPDGVKKLLEEFLKENGIGYSYSKMTKFAVFRSGKLP